MHTAGRPGLPSSQSFSLQPTHLLYCLLPFLFPVPQNDSSCVHFLIHWCPGSQFPSTQKKACTVSYARQSTSTPARLHVREGLAAVAKVGDGAEQNLSYPLAPYQLSGRLDPVESILEVPSLQRVRIKLRMTGTGIACSPLCPRLTSHWRRLSCVPSLPTEAEAPLMEAAAQGWQLTVLSL